MAAAPFSRRWLIAAAGLLACSAHSAYPDKPIKIIVPSVAGSSPDVLVRLVGHALALQLGKPVVIENRGGAGGNIGTRAVAQAAPDGYTLLLGLDATLGQVMALFGRCAGLEQLEVLDAAGQSCGVIHRDALPVMDPSPACARKERRRQLQASSG